MIKNLEQVKYQIQNSDQFPQYQRIKTANDQYLEIPHFQTQLNVFFDETLLSKIQITLSGVKQIQICLNSQNLSQSHKLECKNSDTFKQTHLNLSEVYIYRSALFRFLAINPRDPLIRIKTIKLMKQKDPFFRANTMFDSYYVEPKTKLTLRPKQIIFQPPKKESSYYSLQEQDVRLRANRLIKSNGKIGKGLNTLDGFLFRNLKKKQPPIIQKVSTIQLIASRISAEWGRQQIQQQQIRKTKNSLARLLGSMQ